MEFKERLQNLSARLGEQLPFIETEEATKNALVLPFLAALGYNVFDPREVTPELTADIGTKRGEKVDYAVLHEGNPVILIECKLVKSTLDVSHASQLYRYFSVTEARFGVLTNGIQWQFFSDLDAPNKMDDRPFLEIDILQLDDHQVQQLRKFSKQAFDLEGILESASDLKYTAAIKKVLVAQLSEPSEEFVRFLASSVYPGRLTKTVREQFTELSRKALQDFIRERVRERLKTALAEESAPRETSLPEGEPERPSEPDGIETTEEELEGFYIVKAILAAEISPERVALRDVKSYCGILLDDNNRKPICRLHFDGSQKYVGLFDPDKNETREPLEGPEDLYKFSGEIIATVRGYDAEAES